MIVDKSFALSNQNIRGWSDERSPQSESYTVWPADVKWTVSDPVRSKPVGPAHAPQPEIHEWSSETRELNTQTQITEVTRSPSLRTDV